MVSTRMKTAMNRYVFCQPKREIHPESSGENTAPDSPEKERAMLVARPWDFWNQFVMMMVSGTMLKVPRPIPRRMPRI